MKDEEMAEEYICNRKCQDDVKKSFVYCRTCTRLKDFLAGLKAGRPQWHEADVPTIPINKVVLGCIKAHNSRKFCLVKWNGEWWYDARTWNDKVKLIAWCEIPTFDKVEPVESKTSPIKISNKSMQILKEKGVNK